MADNDYRSFYDKEIAERSTTHYPPFVRLVVITLSHTNSKMVSDGAKVLHSLLQEQIDCKIFGPVIPLVSFIERRFIQQILLKIRPQTLSYNKKVLQDVVSVFRTHNPSMRVSVDVDPY